MRTVRSLEPSIPITDRLSTRLGLLFVGTFLVVFIVLAAWTMLGTISDRRRVAAQSGVAAPVIVIDPKIQTDLAKAMAFDAIPASAEVQNPFVDRAGIGSNVVVASAPAASKSGSSGSSTTTASGSTAGGTSQSPTSFAQVGPSVLVSAYDVKARYDEWIERQRRGEAVVPESEVLGVEDLVPVGFASGGDRAPEVMLYSAALCRTFSFPAGTRFLDGWLNGFDQTEVVFTFQNGIRRKSYSITEPCSGDSRLATITGQD